MQALPPSCPPLPDLSPLFWSRVAERVAFWQGYFAQSDPAAPPIDALRESASPASRPRLKRIEAGKNAGRSLFELADYVACLTVIDSRN